MGRRKGGIKVAVGALALTLATAAVAWACTPQAPIQILGPNMVSAGEQVTVSGRVNSAAPVEIRWNSTEGPVVGSGIPEAGKDLNVQVTTPSVPPGVYYLMATSSDIGVSRAALEVVPGASEAGTPAESGRPETISIRSDLWGGFSSADGAFSDATAPSSADAQTAVMPLGIGLIAVGAFLFGATAIALKSRKTALSRRTG